MCGGRKAAAGEEHYVQAACGPANKKQGTTAILSAMSHLEPVLSPVVEAAGYRLVRLRLMGGKRKTLQIMAERPDGQMDVDDCARLSRSLSDFLDHEDVIEGEYVLEVSSPGIDRPLTRLSDFARWAGHEARIELVAPDASGRKRFKGKLLGVDGSDVAIEVDGTRLSFPHGAVAEAKLLLSDALIQEDLKARKKQA